MIINECVLPRLSFIFIDFYWFSLILQVISKMKDIHSVIRWIFFGHKQTNLENICFCTFLSYSFLLLDAQTTAQSLGGRGDAVSLRDSRDPPNFAYQKENQPQSWCWQAPEPGFEMLESEK